jgi:hypothetical protein
MEGEQTQQFCPSESEFKACSKQTMAELAPKHNNQPHKNIQTMLNELLVVAKPKETRNKQQPAE